MMNCNNSSLDGRLERVIGHNIHCDCISCHNQTHGKPAGSVGNGWQCMYIQANKTMTCGTSIPTGSHVFLFFFAIQLTDTFISGAA